MTTDQTTGSNEVPESRDDGAVRERGSLGFTADSSPFNSDEAIRNGGGRYSCAVLAARRAREITAYRKGAAMVPPTVGDKQDKALSIALEEILVGNVVVAGDDSGD